MSILSFVLWLVIGLFALSSDEEVSKASYACCWVALMAQLFLNL